MIFTLGHSTLTEQEFITAAKGIDVIVDTRSHPGSRAHPQFNCSRMEYWIPALSNDTMQYQWWPGLGGWNRNHLDDEDLIHQMSTVGVDVTAYSGEFPKQRIGAAREATQLDKPEWTNQGLYDYSWFMSTAEFLLEVDELMRTFTKSSRNCAIICCESLWWKCHRSMISDYLFWRKCDSFHLPIKPPKRPTTRRYKPHSEAIGNRLERYDPSITSIWMSHVLERV